MNRDAWQPVSREVAGEAVTYRGYSIVPMRETFPETNRVGKTVRTRFDVIEHLTVPGAAQPLSTRVKTCVSRVSAEGWIDAYGEHAEPKAVVEEPDDEGDDDEAGEA